MASSLRKALVYGGSGALGRGVLKQFSEQGWLTLSVDVASVPKESTQYVTSSCVIDKNAGSLEHFEKSSRAVEKFLKTHNAKTLDCVVHTAGGFVMDNHHENQEQFLEHMEQMYRINGLSACVATCLASRFLPETKTSKSNKVCILTGSYNAFHHWKAGVPVQIMMSYAISKAMLHQLVQCTDKCTTQNNAYDIMCILPKTIDTAANRKAMPDADISKWTPVPEIAKICYQMATHAKNYSNGGFYEIDTTNNVTSCRLVNVPDDMPKKAPL
ncbi:short-chain dehydrogenase/reductase SDR [Reticulomyxa filosa]|uniref:Short-chain dehydrogenase/reductase SDR n=1 Tax=Reticulomyxa filosa TaxID=46433 RepID=X6N9H8_RETFI|nr:short-chain dehydrogenase/reductase SDR [Reticulomyxa filosa]|eukprot:ETO22578.1 short-chain dehydrogenase/reductase SDR [Reticulomyxa filosa]